MSGAGVDYSPWSMRQRPLALVPAALLLAFGVIAGCAEDTPTTDFELTGFVSDDVDGHPIAGATVRFTSDTLYTATAGTDGDGRYEMVVSTDTPFGQVRAEAAGYTPAEKTVYFDSSPRRIDLRLRPEGMAAP